MNFKRFHESKNLFDEDYGTITTVVSYKALYVGNGEFTLSTTAPQPDGDLLFLLAGNVSSGASTSTNGVDKNQSRTVTAIDGYITIGYVKRRGDVPSNYQTMLNTGSTPLPYEPYSSEVWHDIHHYIHNTSTDTITTLPADIYANDTTATVGLKGNMEQSSQPSPTNPIQPQECGDLETTGEKAGQYKIPISSGGENLCPDTGWRLGQYRDGVWETTNTRSTSDFFPVSSNQYRLKINAGQLISFINFNYFDNQKQWLGNRTTLGMSTFSPTAQNIVIPQLPSNAAYMRITIRFYNDNGNPPIPQSFIDDSNIMVSEGTSEPSYEPYNRTITPIYLGEVPTTRKIGKLVLTGEEDWTRTSNNKCYYIDSAKGCPTDYLKSNIITVICSHYEGQRNTNSGSNEVNEGCICFFTGGGYELYIGERTITTAEDFKAYLQQQYAAGTPVTIWYVLANETTGIVNEPLRKIGDYADEVSGITIPTIAGANTISVGTTLQPSEVTVNYKGWHPVADVHEADNGAWT